MIQLVIGTKDSGKSALAEKLSLETGDEVRFYLATMKVYDKAGRERIEKHRKQRAGKGFVTIEKPFGIKDCLKDMDNPGHATVLLECMANLVGNEMYENPEWSLEGIVDEVEYLGSKVNNLIIVTNDYPKDDPVYDDETREYIKTLDLVNDKLVKMADKVFDVRKETEA